MTLVDILSLSEQQELTELGGEMGTGALRSLRNTRTTSSELCPYPVPTSRAFLDLVCLRCFIVRFSHAFTASSAGVLAILI